MIDKPEMRVSHPKYGKNVDTGTKTIDTTTTDNQRCVGHTPNTPGTDTRTSKNTPGDEPQPSNFKRGRTRTANG